MKYPSRSWGRAATLGGMNNDTVERHSRSEDVQALLSGTLLIALGVAMFKHTGLLTGGTAGLAFLLYYATGIAFGKLFFLINLPFYWIAWRRMGRVFTFKTFAAVALLSLFTELQPHVLKFDTLHPLYAAVAGGLLCGTGFLILFRHKASLGGVGIVALMLQQDRGWRAGKIQLVVDCVLVAAALFIVDPERIAYSLVGAVVLNMTLAVNHRPGRYIAM